MLILQVLSIMYPISIIIGVLVVIKAVWLVVRAIRERKYHDKRSK